MHLQKKKEKREKKQREKEYLEKLAANVGGRKRLQVGEVGHSYESARKLYAFGFCFSNAVVFTVVGYSLNAREADSLRMEHINLILCVSDPAELELFEE